MKKAYIVFLLVGFVSMAQTGIGTTTPSPSAKLEVASTNQGFLPPRIALTATNASSPVTSPAIGLLVFNTATTGTAPNNVVPGYYYWNGTLWVRLNGPSDTAANVTGVVQVVNGGTGVTTSTGNGNNVLSNSPEIATPTISSGNTQFPSSITVLPSTFATSRRASLWLSDWGLLQDFTGNGTRNFSITQNVSGSFPSRFFINTDGKIGIGSTNPGTALHIENGNSMGTGNPDSNAIPSIYVYNNNNASTTAHSLVAIRTNQSTGGNPYLSLDLSGVSGFSMGIDNSDGDKLKIHNNWNFNNSEIPALTITRERNIGIGTTSPLAALHVASSVNQSVGAYGFLAWNGTTGASSVNQQNIPYSIQADQRIRAAEFNAVSDTRIKKDIVPLSTTKQLTDLNRLKVVNYSYIDQLANGNKTKTGFIAQEVEKVNTQFVNQSMDFIPSVYDLVKSSTLKNQVLEITTGKPHGFQKGDEVKFYAEGKKEIIKTIEEVKSPNEFTLKGWNEPTDNLFVYGKQVTDFRAIDFDQITALSVGAIQELSKQIQKLQLENAELNKLINNKIQVKHSELEKRLLQLESKLNKKKR